MAQCAVLRGAAPCGGTARAPCRPLSSSQTFSRAHEFIKAPPQKLRVSRRDLTAVALEGDSGGAAITYTSYEGNSWRVEFRKTGVKVLVDPWLVDRLEFGGQAWAFSGTKRVVKEDTLDIDALAAATDFILLSQAIDDHAHRPTLQRLPKSLPVVASPAAAQVARDLGFTSVSAVDHDQEVLVAGGRMRVRGTAGALVGPPWSKRENGFVLREAVEGGASLYYEPHCDFGEGSVAKAGPVDVVVSPPSTQSLLGYDLVKGGSCNVPLLRLLRPRVVIPLENAEFDSSGLLAALLSESGGPAALGQQLAQDGALSGTRLEVPRPGQPLEVEL